MAASLRGGGDVHSPLPLRYANSLQCPFPDATRWPRLHAAYQWYSDNWPMVLGVGSFVIGFIALFVTLRATLEGEQKSRGN